MSLDVAAVAGQVRQMGQDIAATQSDFRDCVRWARLLLRENSQRHAEIAANIRQSKELRTARAALPKEPLATRRAAPLSPGSYVAAAADGSQAEPDRHGHVAYYLINTGTALIRYGPDASASFRSLPHLYYRHEDMYIVEELQPDGPVGKEPREAQIDGEILAMKRAVAEVEDLAKLAQNVPDDTPAVLMVDGTLPLFAKTTGDDAWVGELLKEKYRAALDDIRGMELPVVGFISRSNASWVMDMLQVGVCRRKTDSCAFCHGRDGGQGPACALARLRDRFLYDGTIDEPEVPSPLQPGERSALFQMSAGLYRDYGWNEPCMFYLNTGREIAQVQVPMWLTRKEGLLNQVHALVYAQCANGGGYPTVLTRAHEQAVVSAADRETLDALVLIQLLKLGVRVPVSEKARSKQVRGI